MRFVTVLLALAFCPLVVANGHDAGAEWNKDAAWELYFPTGSNCSDLTTALHVRTYVQGKCSMTGAASFVNATCKDGVPTVMDHTTSDCSDAGVVRANAEMCSSGASKVVCTRPTGLSGVWFYRTEVFETQADGEAVDCYSAQFRLASKSGECVEKMLGSGEYERLTCRSGVGFDAELECDATCGTCASNRPNGFFDEVECPFRDPLTMPQPPPNSGGCATWDKASSVNAGILEPCSSTDTNPACRTVEDALTCERKSEVLSCLETAEQVAGGEVCAEAADVTAQAKALALTCLAQSDCCADYAAVSQVWTASVAACTLPDTCKPLSTLSHKVQLPMDLPMTAAEFESAAVRLEFVMAVAAAADVQPAQCVIKSVTEKEVRRRLLATAIEVVTEIASPDAAGSAAVVSALTSGAAGLATSVQAATGHQPTIGTATAFEVANDATTPAPTSTPAESGGQRVGGGLGAMQVAGAALMLLVGVEAAL